MLSFAKNVLPFEMKYTLNTQNSIDEQHGKYAADFNKFHVFIAEFLKAVGRWWGTMDHLHVFFLRK